MSEEVGSPHRRTGFSLSYDLRPEDFQQLVSRRTRARRRNWRAQAVSFVILFGILAVALTAFTVALDISAATQGSSAAPSWMYAVDVLLWAPVVLYARLAWRLSPKRLVQRAWEQNPQLHGRHRDLVEQPGLTEIGPDGAWTMIPWANFSEVDENDEAFRLIDHGDEPRAILPKRGLGRPASVPALREFLNRSVTAQPAAPAPADPAPAGPDPEAGQLPGPAGETGLSLAYELEPDDMLAANRKYLSQRRERTEASIAGSGLALAVIVWQTAGHGSSATPSWLYVAGGVLLLLFLSALQRMWRLSPRRYAKRAYQRVPQRQGRILDLVQPGGVITIEPDGARVAVPWSAVDRVDEANETFRLIDRHGMVRKTLFKRALPRPELVSALRDFINNSVAASRAATGPSPDAAVKQP